MLGTSMLTEYLPPFVTGLRILKLWCGVSFKTLSLGSFAHSWIRWLRPSHLGPSSKGNDLRQGIQLSYVLPHPFSLVFPFSFLYSSLVRCMLNLANPCNNLLHLVLVRFSQTSLQDFSWLLGLKGHPCSASIIDLAANIEKFAIDFF